MVTSQLLLLLTSLSRLARWLVLGSVSGLVGRVC